MISPEHAEKELRDLMDATHPVIDGRYQVHGFRAGSVEKCHRHDKATIDALRREAEIWIRLGNHPNIVQLLNIIAQSEATLFLVMEWIRPTADGKGTLRDWMVRIWGTANSIRSICRKKCWMY